MGVKGILTVMAAILLVFGSGAAAGQKQVDLDEALAGVTLFSGLTAQERALLKPAARLIRAGAGDEVITQGSTMGRIFIVLDGRADIRINGNSLVEISGEILLGEVEFLDGQPASASVVMVEDADCLVLDNLLLNRIMAEHPRVGYLVCRQMGRILAERLRQNNGQK